jgi:REP element-mobilizing transposase RayT
LLAEHFAISVCGFAILDNHLHILARLDPKASTLWSPQEVLQRWFAVYPPKQIDSSNPATFDHWIRQQAKDKKTVEKFRGRLSNLGWFMKALKEPLARLANQEDGCKGNFWESRYKSIAILDEEALLAVCAYIDLNPLAAGLAATPESSLHTSVRQRVVHARKCGKLESLKEAARSSVAGSQAVGRMEDSHWLCPFEDGRRKGSKREGMLENFSLGSYLLLVDYTSRLCRPGKARVSKEMAGIFERLKTSSDQWEERLRKLMGTERLKGSHFAVTRQTLRSLAKAKGVHHLDNVLPLPTTK